MNKLIYFLITILLVGCSYNNKKLVTDERTTITNNEFAQDKNVQVDYYKKGEENLYKYKVYDNSGNIMYEETISKDPIIKRLEGKIIKIGISAGTGLFLVRYFDTQKKLTSKVFSTPWDECYTKLIRFGKKNKVIIQDMFDNQTYYEETLPLMDTADVNNAIISAEFTRKNKVEIKFYNKDEVEETKIITINK